MNIRLTCPACDQPGRLDSPLPADWLCPRCDQVLHLKQGAAEPTLTACAVCGNAELYRKKDFPHSLGMAILVLSCLTSTITYWLYQKWWTWGILIGSALFDCVLNLFASIDQDDTNWIVTLKDVGPDPSVRTAREGEREISSDLPERELTRGWLKASHRALDPQRSTPSKPWHPLTRGAQKPVTPHEVTAYAIEILATANLFRAGHRICIEIACADMPTGVSGATNVEYIPYHICSSKTVLHKIHHDAKHPSHLLLPIIPHRNA